MEIEKKSVAKQFNRRQVSKIYKKVFKFSNKKAINAILKGRGGDWSDQMIGK